MACRRHLPALSRGVTPAAATFSSGPRAARLAACGALPAGPGPGGLWNVTREGGAGVMLLQRRRRQAGRVSDLVGGGSCIRTIYCVRDDNAKFRTKSLNLINEFVRSPRFIVSSSFACLAQQAAARRRMKGKRSAPLPFPIFASALSDLLLFSMVFYFFF